MCRRMRNSLHAHVTINAEYLGCCATEYMTYRNPPFRDKLSQKMLNVRKSHEKSLKVPPSMLHEVPLCMYQETSKNEHISH